MAVGLLRRDDLAEALAVVPDAVAEDDERFELGSHLAVSFFDQDATVKSPSM
jgi:hypothetical protein